MFSLVLKLLVYICFLIPCKYPNLILDIKYELIPTLLQEDSIMETVDETVDEVSKKIAQLKT
jgi:hypothetical protein